MCARQQRELTRLEHHLRHADKMGTHAARFVKHFKRKILMLRVFSLKLRSTIDIRSHSYTVKFAIKGMVTRGYRGLKNYFFKFTKLKPEY